MMKFFDDVLGIQNEIEIVRTTKLIINADLFVRQYKPLVVFPCYTVIILRCYGVFVMMS